jgi:hypothetical protein
MSYKDLSRASKNPQMLEVNRLLGPKFHGRNSSKCRSGAPIGNVDGTKNGFSTKTVWKISVFEKEASKSEKGLKPCRFPMGARCY